MLDFVAFGDSSVVLVSFLVPFLSFTAVDFSLAAFGISFVFPFSWIFLNEDDISLDVLLATVCTVVSLADFVTVVFDTIVFSVADFVGFSHADVFAFGFSIFSSDLLDLSSFVLKINRNDCHLN